MIGNRQKKLTALKASSALLSVWMLASAPAFAAAELSIPVSRAQLVTLPKDMSEVIVADPEIADVHVHGGTRSLSIIAKKPGQTNIRVLDRESKVMQTYDVKVGYDLPAIRKALKNFLPDEMIGVEMVNTNLALTGQVSSTTVADKAVRIVSEFAKSNKEAADQAPSADAAGGAAAPSGIINLLQITSGQQVMLRVRIGEIQRDALKRLGIDPAAGINSGNFFFQGGLGSAALGGLALGNSALADYTIPADQFHGTAAAGWTNGNDRAFGVFKALERDGLFKLLAEPNLVAISGEQAEFLAGGEVPVPVPQQGSSGSSATVTIEYKPFGVAVKFRPFVLSESRIRMEVQPEVSELDATSGVTISGFTVPGISTRRAKTTVELAPGESFMIAGLIKDQTRSQIDQLPGVKELPILGALFRSTDFQRNETELVIAVTPFMVDPIKSSDVKLPTDNFTPASQMEMMFYGALGSMSNDAYRISQTPSLEGPIGFLVD